MDKILQSVGIHMARDKFDVCFIETKAGLGIVIGTKSFKNNSTGFEEFMQGKTPTISLISKPNLPGPPGRRSGRPA